MCDTAVLENDETLESVLHQYKTQEMCNKVVDNYAHTLEFVPECYKTQEMCDKAVNNYPYTKNLFLNAIRGLKKSVIRLLVGIFLLYLVLFLIGIKLKEFVTKLFTKILLC